MQSAKDTGHFELRARTHIHAPSIIAIGSSTGGLQALADLFDELGNVIIELPIVITQHLPENFDGSFASELAEHTNCRVKVAEHREELVPGTIYFAPAEKHLLIDSQLGKKICLIDNSPPVNFCKPAVDPMFRSVAKTYKKKVMAVVLTGIGNDGLAGAREIVNAGGTVIAQDKESSVVWGMPGAVAAEGLCSAILPLTEIPKFLKDYSFGKIR